MEKKKRKRFTAVSLVICCYAVLNYIGKRKKNPSGIDKENIYLSGECKACNERKAKRSFYEKYVKTLIDKLLSFIGLFILAPLYMLISLAIFLDDPGPVLFTQKRVGKGKHFFLLHKFRSMKISSPHDIPTHQLKNPEQYITRVGKFLRKYSLDELPQIWDIFVGNMSIIGPRPALWNQEDLVVERDKYGANDVMPGLTGLAQIKGRDKLSILEKAALDGEYTKQLYSSSWNGFYGDVKCFFGTIYSVLRQDGVIEGSAGRFKENNKNRNSKSKGLIIVLSSHTPSLFWFRIEMMQEFQRLGYDVIAVGNESMADWKERFEAVGIPYKQIYVSRNGTNPVNDIKTIKSIVGLLRETKPDKIFAFQAKTVIYGSIAARIVGIKDIYLLIAGVGSLFLSDNLKTRVLRRILITEYCQSLKYAKLIFFQNSDDVKTFTDYGIISKNQEIVMIPGSGVNTEHFISTPFPDKMGFLCISRLIRDKGVYEYLEACKLIKEEFPGVRCMLMGPYDSNPTALTSDQLQAFKDDGIIEYFGEQKDVRPYINQSNVYVLPSYREGMPKTVLEAMSSGRAIITTDAPGCREAVVDGENGLLVPVRDMKALKDAMKQMVLNPNMVKEMGGRSREIAVKRFDVKIVNQMICEAMEL